MDDKNRSSNTSSFTTYFIKICMMLRLISHLLQPILMSYVTIRRFVYVTKEVCLQFQVTRMFHAAII